MISIFKTQTFRYVATAFVCIIILLSCEDKEDLIGIWDDNIKLSTKSADFTAATDSITITTEGEWWWVNNVTFQDSIYTYNMAAELDSYSIQEDCFTIERRNKRQLFIKINENNSGIERLLCITLEAGDYFDYVTINQAAN
jgi:hypothetical protein